MEGNIIVCSFSPFGQLPAALVFTPIRALLGWEDSMTL
jgi:hypothetical protein